MRCITFSGVDGSGKSTQLELLRERLVFQGKKVAYFHAVEFSLANRLARFFKGQKSFAPGKEKALTKASWLSLHTRLTFLFIDMVRFSLLRKKLRNENYDYLLSDRFFYDSIVNIEYLRSANSEHSTINNGQKSASLFSVLCSLFLYHPDIAFYFDIAPEIILSRERVPEQGVEYLHAKQKLFRQRVIDWNMIAVDANRDKESIFQDILTKI